MWVYTRPRNPHDIPFLLNLELCSRININQLGERWFVEVMLGTEAVPVATADSEEDAGKLLGHILRAIDSGDRALDLNALPQEVAEPGHRQQDNSGATVVQANPPDDPHSAPAMQTVTPKQQPTAHR